MRQARCVVVQFSPKSSLECCVHHTVPEIVPQPDCMHHHTAYTHRLGVNASEGLQGSVRGDEGSSSGDGEDEDGVQAEVGHIFTSTPLPHSQPEFSIWHAAIGQQPGEGQRCEEGNTASVFAAGGESRGDASAVGVPCQHLPSDITPTTAQLAEAAAAASNEEDCGGGRAGGAGGGWDGVADVSVEEWANLDMALQAAGFSKLLQQTSKAGQGEPGITPLA